MILINNIEFRPIPSHPRFLCSEQGVIYSTRLKRELKGHLRKKDGYIEMGIREKGAHDLAHRLIAETWIPNPENKGDVNHINGIKHDNRMVNLEWATRSENLLHAYRTGLKTKSGKGHGLGKNNPVSRIIIQYDMDGNKVGQFYGTGEIKRKFGFAPQGINLCCLGKAKSAYKFIWRYA